MLTVSNQKGKGWNLFAYGGCKFFVENIDGKEVGVKVWVDKVKALAQFKMQRMASKAGIGPKVYGKVRRIEIKDGRITYMGWGFLTEIANVDFNRIYADALIQKLDRKFANVFGHHMVDFHEGNIGTINGKLVVIDFDLEG